MSEIKPVYQVQTYEGRKWEDCEKDFYESILKNNPQLSEVRILYPAAAYEALQKENAEYKKRVEALVKAYDREVDDCLAALKERDYWYDKADSLADKISECFDVPVGEHSNVNCPFDEANKILDGEYVTKFDKESATQAKRIEELEAATEHLGLTPQQAADGLARHKAQVAEIESLRKQVKLHEETQSNELIKLRETVQFLEDKQREVTDILLLRIGPFEIIKRAGAALLAKKGTE